MLVKLESTTAAITMTCNVPKVVHVFAARLWTLVGTGTIVPLIPD